MADTGEEKKIPGLEKIPVLPADYPLFDWADWPESRAALQPGVATIRFQKDAWNDIVNTLNDALNAVGLDPGLDFKLEETLMLTPYSRFRASDVNRMEVYIEQFTPFPWPWAYDPSFRGYTGRKVFRGTTIEYDENGAVSRIIPGEEVYPEYILELARRVNLLLELMRGTADTVESPVLKPGRLLIQSTGAVTRMGTGMGRYYIARTGIAGLTLGGFSGTGFNARYLTESLARAAMEKVPGAGISKWLPFYSRIALSGRAARDEQVPRIREQLMMSSTVRADAGFINPSYMQAEGMSRSLGTARFAQIPPMITSGQQASFSTAAVAADARNDLKTTSAQQQSYTSLQMDIMSIIPRFVVTEHRVNTLQQLEILLTKMIEVLMHTDLQILLRGGGDDTAVRNILMALGDDSAQVMGSGRQEDPLRRILHSIVPLLHRSGAVAGLFEPQLGHLFLHDILTANSVSAAPAAAMLLSVAGLLRTVRPRAELPSVHLMQTVRADRFHASGQLELPERTVLNGLMLMIGKTDIRAYREHKAFLNWLERLIYYAAGRLEYPLESKLLMIGRSTAAVYASLQNPTKSEMLLLPMSPSVAAGFFTNPNDLYMKAVAWLLPAVTDGNIENITEIRMWTERFELIGFTMVAVEEPKDIRLLQLPYDHFRLSGRCQTPADLFLFRVDRCWTLASSRVQKPEDLFGLVELWPTMMGQGREDAPRDRFLLIAPTRLRNANGRVQPPNDLLGFVELWPTTLGQGKEDAPRNRYSHILGALPWSARVWQDAPREVLQWISGMDLQGLGAVKGEMPEELYQFSADGFLPACLPRQDVPREHYLWLSDHGTEMAALGRDQTPAVLFLMSELGTKPWAAASVQGPNRLILNCISDMQSIFDPALQLPNVWLLEVQDRMISITDPQIALPWAYRACSIESGNILISADLQNPDAIQLIGTANLAAMANWALLLRRPTQGIAELLDQAFLTADLTVPEAVRMLFGMQMMTIAHAGILNRKAVHTSGYLAELIGGSLTAALSEAVTLLMATSAGLYTEAGSDIAYVSTLGGGILQLEVDADLGGYTIRIVTTRGGILFEVPEICAAADTADALHGAGRRIELEIGVQLGGISARYASTRMWAAVPIPKILAGGDGETVRSILAVASIKKIEAQGRSRRAGAVRGDGNTEFCLVAMGGGLVRSADNMWQDPVQTGSNLHITHVQQSWNDGDKLYVDLDVFYEPIRKGSDLYIRSADYVWTDGDSANIDTEFFLDPVQEGSNLHIRQDIFGGE